MSSITDKIADMDRPKKPGAGYEPKSASRTALDVQVGGEHYRKLRIQPVEYIFMNGLPFIEGSIIKYVTRWRDKGGVKDLEKAKHFIDLLIEMDSRGQS